MGEWPHSSRVAWRFSNQAMETNMTVTMVVRYSVSDTDVAISESKRAKAMWSKAGAKDFRGVQMFTGAFHGEWIFYIDFDD